MTTHCDAHAGFQYDCLDCSDALAAFRKAPGPLPPFPWRARQANVQWVHGGEWRPLATASPHFTAEARGAVASYLAAMPDAVALLRRAAVSLQEYAAEQGDTNDALAMEIEKFLEGKP